MFARVLAVVFALSTGVTGCAVPNSVGGYFEDRRQDLIDAAHVDGTFMGFGLLVHAGPLMLGWQGRGKADDALTFELGLGGLRIMHYPSGVASGLVWPISRWSAGSPCFYGPRPKVSPSWSAAGVSVGWFFATLGVRLDPYEALDFALGLFCLDIGGDDESTFEHEEEDDALKEHAADL